MKRFKRMLATMLACLMVVTSFNLQSLQAEAAPEGTFEEVSIFNDSANTISSGDAGRGSGSEYNGWILNVSDYGDAKYLKMVFTIEEGVNSWDWVLALQPHDSSWAASSYLGVWPSLGDFVDGKYIVYYSIEEIEASLNGASCDEITLVYTSATSNTTVEDVLLCTEKEAEPITEGVSILSAPVTASDDAGRTTESGYNGWIMDCSDFADADALKIVFTVGETVNPWDWVLALQPHSEDWSANAYLGIWPSMCEAKDGKYICNYAIEDILSQLNGAECAAISIAYGSAGYPTAVEDVLLYTENVAPVPTDAPVVTSASLDYMKAMGDGWNLGNSFDGVNTALDEEDLGEVAWGNPVVTKELIQAAADKGYDSIRIPITFYRRFNEETYVIDEAWLARVKEVVQWSLDEGLHVMINVHHDSWLWLKYWDGNKESEEYVKFAKLWEQFAAYFKDMPLEVCFETINEPTFEATGDISAQKKLDMVNQAAYDAIRNSGGNNEARMIVIPTFTTNHGDEYVNPTISFIEALDDENVMATVHYYSEWVHSAGIGKTGFDEVLWDDYTPRDSVDLFFETLQKKFLDKGIGVIVGEWGLLGYDSASQVNQAGEELKYYEYMNYYANEKDVCLMFWDNGSGISRTSGNYEWKKPLVGEMLETSMSERSAYVTDLDRVFFNAEATEDVTFKLTLNGLTFSGIDGLTEGTDYTYDADTATVTLSKAYVNAKYAVMGEKYGTFAELVFKFSGGADWHEYLIKYDVAVATETSGTTADIKIPVEFRGSEVRRATAYMASGKVGPNSSWWDYLQYGGAFLPDYETGTIAVLSGFWNDPTVVDGEITFHFEMYDGSMMKYTLKKDGTNVTGYPAIDASQVTMECANEICVYVGETKIKDTYFNIPDGTSVYGTYAKPDNATDYITLNGWPATMTFGTKAQENSIEIGLMLTYMDRIEYPGNITFWLKDAPVVEGVTVKEGESGTLIVKNLAEAAQVTYEVEDSSIATVSEDGVVTGVKEGTTKVIATVTQYGRTDSFEAGVTVEDTLQCDGKVDADEVKENIELSEEEKQNITEVEIILQIVDLGKEIAEEVKAAFEEKMNGFKVGSYFDIDLFKQFGTNTPDKAKLTGPVKISFMIPAELRNANYSFRLLKYHDNEVKEVVITVSDDYKLTFESDEFSTYALVYYETAAAPAPAPAPTTAPEATTAPVAAISPKTGDANNMLLWFALMAVTAGSALIVAKKRKENL